MQGNPVLAGRSRARHFTTRIVIVLAVAALIPLVAFGSWAFLSLQRETRRSTIDATMARAERDARDMERELLRHIAMFDALATDLQRATPSVEQQLAILDNYEMRFPALRAISLFDARGGIVSSREGGPPRPTPAARTVGDSRVSISPLVLDDALVTSALFASPIGDPMHPSGWVSADVALDHLHELVDGLRVGPGSRTLVVAADGTVIAEGPRKGPERLPHAATLASHPLLGSQSLGWRQFSDNSGEDLLAVAAPIAPTDWVLMVEQPTREAFAASRRLGLQLALAACVAALLMMGSGIVLGRRAIAPVQALERATQALASGDFSARVDVPGDDEFARLGRSFNTMADRLVTLQHEIKRQERQVIFGRVAAGLVHDLSQPVQTIEHSARTLLREDLDEETRGSVRQTLTRELHTLRRFMDDLFNVARPLPLDRAPLDVNTAVANAVEAVRADAERAQLALATHCAPGLPPIEADRFALGRIYRNLLMNAIQATPPGGRVSITTRQVADAVEIDVADTGSGIAPGRLGTLFEEFVTTRRRGLGLGLATSRQLVEQLGGSIAVTSELEIGTTFTLRFPASTRLAVEVAS